MSYNALFKELFGRQLHEPESSAFLNDVVEKYPYFSIAHFYRLKKAVDDGASSTDIAPLSALHFNNVFLLEKRLHESLEDSAAFGDYYPEEKVMADHQGREGADSHINSQPLADNSVTPQPNTASFSDDVNINPDTFASEDTVHENATQAFTAEPIVVNKPEPEIIIAPDGAAQATEEEFGQMGNETAETIHENATEAFTAEPVMVNNPQPEIIIAPQPETQSADDGDPGNESPIFEPLHATDYFASQGIRITDELVQEDLSLQRKSFTAWLRSMKKLNASYVNDRERPIDPVVEKLAVNSNTETDIVTEAMAEAYLKQGKTLKAIDVYRKLSLQNPAKSGYFAAKIDLLK